MKGNIYTEQRCPVCGLKYPHDERRGGFFCAAHGTAATRFRVKFGRGIRKKFHVYAEAVRFLNGLRFKEDEGTLDARDYQADQPLDIQKLVDEYLLEKAGLATFRDLQRMLFSAAGAMPGSIKLADRARVKKWLFGLPVSEKTRANYRSAIHAFLVWCKGEGYISAVPDVPTIEYELGWRKITDWETQAKVVAKVEEIAPVRVWIGIDLLRTYTALRPGDLLRLEEKDVGAELVFWNPTKLRSKRKVVRLLPEHATAMAWEKRQFFAPPSAKFFRHTTPAQSVTVGDPFGEKYLYKWWKKACAILGVEGLDLYGGTRHTTVSALALAAGTDSARDASGHETNKAFDRYCQTQSERALEMAKLVRGHQGAPVVDLSKVRK